MHHDNICSAYGRGATHEERRGHACPGGSPPHYYSTYGLGLASYLELPELRPQQRPGTPVDVEIIAGDLPDTLEDPDVSSPWLQASRERCQFYFDGIARYRVEHGRRIRIDRRIMLKAGARTSEEDLRLYLLGTVLGALLHQRHWLPLHLSALETPSGVWGFTADSGAGKSTLAAWLHYRTGWPLVSDDVGVIRPGDDLPYLYPGPPRLKLWKDALTTLGIDHHGLIRDRARADKYHLVRHHGFCPHVQPLSALVMLERGEEGEDASLVPLDGLEAFKTVMASIYRPEWGTMFNGPARLMLYAADLAQRIRIYRYRRPWSLERMEESLAPLVQRIHGR